MQYVNLGNSGLQVSRACLGAMMFGHTNNAPTDETESRRIIDAFLDAGGNFIDTANVYVGGESEEVVGRAVKAKRDDVVIATKGFGADRLGPQHDGPRPEVPDPGIGRKSPSARYRVRRPLSVPPARSRHADRGDDGNAALVRRVRQGALHRLLELDGQPDRRSPMGRQGQWRYTICQLAAALLARGATDRGGRAAGLPAPRTRHDDLQPARRRRAHGQVHRRASPRPPTAVPAATKAGAPACSTSESLDTADAVGKVAAELGTTSTAVAIAWVLSRRGVTSVIIGPRTFEQYEQNMEAFDLELDPAVVKRLSDLSRWAR